MAKFSTDIHILILSGLFISPNVKAQDDVIYYQQNEYFTEDKKGELIFFDSFDVKSEIWVLETVVSPSANAKVENGTLIIDVNRGTTVWLKKKLSGNYVIEYSRKVIIENGENDRLCDLNQFWMADDPKNPEFFYPRKKFSGI